MPSPTIADLAKMFDHSLLQPSFTDADLEKGILLARELNVASVCIKPYGVKLAAKLLAGSTVVASTVIGFPHGGHVTRAKVYESELAMDDGAMELDMVVNVGGTPSTCVAIHKGLQTLGISEDKVVGDFSCGLDSEKAAYGGDLPHWYFGEAPSGDALTDSQIGQQYRAALAAFGASKNVSDVWYSGMFGTIATIAQFMNKAGYDKVSPATLATEVKAFRGPLLLGEPKVFCGKYPSAPANCGGGDRFFKYEGNGVFSPVSIWTDVPLPLQKQLNAKGV